MWTADPPTVCTTLLRLVSRCRAMVRGGLRRSRRTRARSLARASTLGIILSVTSLKWAKSNLIHKTHLNLDFDACGENKESTSRKAYFIHAHTSGDLEWSKEMNYYFFFLYTQCLLPFYWFWNYETLLLLSLSFSTPEFRLNLLQVQDITPILIYFPKQFTCRRSTQYMRHNSHFIMSANIFIFKNTTLDYRDAILIILSADSGTVCRCAGAVFLCCDPELELTSI